MNNKKVYVAVLSNDYGELDSHYKASLNLDTLISSILDEGFGYNFSGNLERVTSNGYESEWIDIKEVELIQ